MKIKIATTIIGLILLAVLFCVQTNRKSIDIDKTNHILTACETRSRCFTLPITTGSKESPTKNGHFKVLNKIENVQSYHGYIFPILSVEDMQRLYEWSEVGTLIFIHN